MYILWIEEKTQNGKGPHSMLDIFKFIGAYFSIEIFV